VPTGHQGSDSPALTGAPRRKKVIIKIIKTQHHGIKFKEWSLRLKLATLMIGLRQRQCCWEENPRHLRLGM